MEFQKGDKVMFSKKAIQGRFCDKFSNGKKTAGKYKWILKQ